VHQRTRCSVWVQESTTCNQPQHLTKCNHEVTKTRSTHEEEHTKGFFLRSSWLRVCPENRVYSHKQSESLHRSSLVVPAKPAASGCPRTGPPHRARSRQP